MKKLFDAQVRKFLMLLALLLPMPCAAQQFLEVTAEIAYDNWDYRFFADGLNRYDGEKNFPSVFTTNFFVRCVVGTNTWHIRDKVPQGTYLYWFTGSNIVEQFNHAGGQPSSPDVPPFPRTYKSLDGNPGQPERVIDLMGLGDRVAWLAFCSGSFLKHEGRKIYPPNDFWKESQLVYSGWSDQTTAFEDDLGLPKTVILLATNKQPAFRYQTRGSTNVLGWNFPREFYCVQYWPRSNVWEVDWTAKGRVLEIKKGNMPDLPQEVRH